METHGGFHPPQSSPFAGWDDNATPMQIGPPAKGDCRNWGKLG